MSDGNYRQLNNARRVSLSTARYIDLCVYVTVISNFLILLGNPLDIDFIVSLATRAMMIFILALAVFRFLNSMWRGRVDRVDALFVAILAWSAICFVFTTRTALMGRLINYLCFLTLPAYMTMYRDVRRVGKLKKLVYWCNFLYFALFVILSLSDKAHIYHGRYGIVDRRELTLGYNNPNETGMYLLMSFLIMLCAYTDTVNKTKKTVLLVCAGILLVLVYQTESRICIVLALLFAVLMLLKRREALLGKIYQLVPYLPILSMAFFMLAPEAVRNLLFMGDILDTGRYGLFDRFFDSADGMTYMVGDFLVYGGSNLHNSMLSIVAMFGVPMVALYIVFLKWVMRYYFSRLQSAASYVAFGGFLLLLTHGIAEGTLLVSGAVFAGLCGLFFVLMLPEEAAE